MAAVVVLGVIALIAAIVAWVTWHRGADERHSVQHHQHTLETLRHVADRRPPSVWTAPGRRSSATKDRPISRRNAGTVGAGAAAGVARNPIRESAKVDASRRATVAFTDDVVRAPGGEGRGGEGSLSRRMGARLPGAAERARRDGRARRASNQVRRRGGGDRRLRCRRGGVGARRIPPSGTRRVPGPHASGATADGGRARVTDHHRRLVRPHPRQASPRSARTTRPRRRCIPSPSTPRPSAG